jgi:hypothetical protein
MADAELKGKWVASSVTEGTIKELWTAGYIPTRAACRAPKPDQRIPTPKPRERVIFVPHLI